MRLGDELDLLLGGALQALGGLVEVLDDVELAEHHLELLHDGEVLDVGGLLLLGRGLRVRGTDGLFQVGQHAHDFGLAQPAQPVGHVAEHLLLGGDREALVAHRVERGLGAAGRLVDPRLNLLLLVPLLGRVEVLGLGGRQGDDGHDQREGGCDAATATGNHRRGLLEAGGARERCAPVRIC